MDGDEKQESAGLQIQAEVKKQARRRRNKAHLQKAMRNMNEDDSSPSSAAQSQGSHVQSPDTAATVYTISHTSGASDSPVNTSSAVFNGAFLTTGELELSCIMSYLDYVFPTMFPLYTPPITRSGRGWLLVRIMNNETLRHVIISLTTHFFSVVPVIDNPERRICERWSNSELVTRTAQAINRLQQDISDPKAWNADYTLGSGHSSLRSKVHLLESIIHLMLLEVSSTHAPERWEMHLDAATTLFRQIANEALQSTNAHPSDGCLASVFKQLSPSPLHAASSPFFPDLTPWIADQASFYFCATVLVTADIISSVSLQRAPVLRDYHSLLLASDSQAGDGGFLLEASDLFGCQTQVFEIISCITQLDVWKKEQKELGAFCITTLTERGGVIDQRLREAIACTGGDASSSSFDSTHSPTEEVKGAKDSQTALVTRIWAHAARIHLHVVLSGWQALNPVISQTVNEIMHLLQSLTPRMLSALAWPFCVAGCMAKEEQECLFRGIASTMGATAAFGTTKIALEVMEEVWRQRNSASTESWNMASALGVLERHVLLL